MKKTLSNLMLGKIVNKTVVDKPFATVLEALKKSIETNDFKVSVIHDNKEVFKKNNLPLDPDFEFSIIQFCNAPKAHMAITTLSHDVGIMMPKSIVVSRENGKTSIRFMQMKPWMVGMMFPEINLIPLSTKVMVAMKKIVKDAVAELEK
jgi:uncharacterized protein (DUF302 family)